jgi:DNA polymerase-3 subunit epsilon
MPATRKHGRTESERAVREAIRKLPNTSGVYLFYGEGGNLLYVGKSKSIRTRVRSHFSSREEVRLCRQIRQITIRPTAGELGALLLESQLIKTLRPMYNRMSRHRRRIILARRMVTSKGYFRVVLEAVCQIDPARTQDILGIFKTRTQANEFLSAAAKSHRLCLNLLGLDHSKRSCFSFHLHQCNGACIGLEPPLLYNPRLEQAFEDRRIKAWPFPGAVIIEENCEETGDMEVFVVDNWCLLYSFACSAKKHNLSVRGLHHFDYDSYRILAGYVFHETHQDHIRLASKDEISALIRRTHAA